MTLEEELNTPNTISSHHANHHHHFLMDWLEDSISILPTFLNEPYSVLEELLPCDWFLQDQNPSFPIPAAAAAAPPLVTKPEPLPITPKSSPPKKRKLSARGGNTTSNSNSNSNSNSAANVNKEVRWAEQLLNPLSAAIDATNLSRAQHLVYVLQELASPTGDANHRLAFYGLQSLSRHFSSTSLSSPLAFASSDPRTFRSALIKFHEVSAWFAFPNCLANAAILQAAQTRHGNACLHLVDAGVSHGLQWPTLMEAMTRRGAGTMVKLTVVEAGSDGVFGSAPIGYDFAPQLMRYAKSIDLNLRIERGGIGRRGVGRELVVLCLGFRMGRMGEGFWKEVREVEPDMVVVTEIEEGRGERGFGRRAEVLWRFLESTSVAFKGKDGEERRVVEGEGARLLEEERVGWRERMEGEGFREEGFGEEVLEMGRGLLKKYDGNWEMRIDGGDGAVGLCWKGQVVSSCSLWTPVYKGVGGGGRRH